jgi:hypothetical protein
MNYFSCFLLTLAMGSMSCSTSKLSRESNDPSLQHDYQPLTTPALERIHEIRKTGASQTEWESNLAERIEIVMSKDRLESILSEWELSLRDLNHWKQQYSRANQVIFYGTDLDGRMLIFFDSRDQSIATWASWDPELKTENQKP